LIETVRVSKKIAALYASDKKRNGRRRRRNFFFFVNSGERFCCRDEKWLGFNSEISVIAF
jgi:hypothetical protein